MKKSQKRRKFLTERQLQREALSKEVYLRKLLKSYSRWLQMFGKYGDPCLRGAALYTRSLPRG